MPPSFRRALKALKPSFAMALAPFRKPLTLRSFLMGATAKSMESVLASASKSKFLNALAMACAC